MLAEEGVKLDFLVAVSHDKCGVLAVDDYGELGLPVLMVFLCLVARCLFWFQV